MTPDDVRERLEEIVTNARDPEAAHGMEDDLRAAVLQAIAEGSCTDPVEAARLALRTSDIDFPRWYA
jgi:hypothetical protein